MIVDTIADPIDERLLDYRDVREPVLLRQRGTFIAESREVVRLLLEGGRYRVRSLFMTAGALRALEEPCAALPADTPVYVAGRAVMRDVIGYDVHRGCLAAVDRPARWPLSTFLDRTNPARLYLGLDAVSNPDNVGSSFRNALAFGAAGVLLGPGCADPLYRKAVRTSMAATLRLPYCHIGGWVHELERLEKLGFVTIGLTPGRSATAIGEVARQCGSRGRVLLLVGAEGPGLSEELLDAANWRARIPIRDDVDSLNVAVAAAIALHTFSAMDDPK